LSYSATFNFHIQRKALNLRGKGIPPKIFFLFSRLCFSPFQAILNNHTGLKKRRRISITLETVATMFVLDQGRNRICNIIIKAY
jgi:hypothetical protein